MKIHEYQGKQLFKQYGVPVLRGTAVKLPPMPNKQPLTWARLSSW